MGTPFIGEIKMFAGNFAPVGWQFCDGQVLAISDNDALFSLIGTTYGGDGQSTFALPDLRGRVPMHPSSGYDLGQPGGAEQVTLTLDQHPGHGHQLMATTAAGTVRAPKGQLAAQTGGVQLYSEEAPSLTMAAGMIGTSGNSEPHENRQPYLSLTFIIAVEGIYPSSG
jgi:microcystin-dependent protein